MTIELSLDKEDFLTYHLYAASKSEEVNKSRRMTRTWIPVIYAVLSVVLYYYDVPIVAGIFLSGSVLWYIMTPKYQRKRYINYFSRQIEANYKNRIGQPGTLIFSSNAIEARGKMGKGKYNLSDAVELNEIENYFFLKFSNGESLIFPKKKINQLADLKDRLHEIVQQYKIKYNRELDWKWR